MKYHLRMWSMIALLFITALSLSCPAGERANSSKIPAIASAPAESVGQVSPREFGIDSFESVRLFQESEYKHDLKILSGEEKVVLLGNLPDSGEFRFHHPTVPADKLTDKEKMLLYGWRATFEGRNGFITPLLATNFNFLKDKQVGMLYSRTTEEMMIRILGKEEYDGLQNFERASRRAKTIYRNHLSPITGRPLEIDKKEFSPGNAYIRVIDDPKVLSAIESQFKRQNHRYEKIFDKLLFVYERVYGEQGIIRERFNVLSSPEFASQQDFWGGNYPPPRVSTEGRIPR